MVEKPTYEELEKRIKELDQEVVKRRQDEVELRESERLLKKSQAIAHIGSWELNLATNRLTWSDEVYRMFGLRPQEFDATYDAFLDTVHPDDRAAVGAAYSGSLLEGRDTYEIEHRIVRRDSGEVRIVYEKCEHLKDASCQLVKSIGMVSDITELKHAEKTLQQRTHDLDERVKELNCLYGISNLVENPDITLEEICQGIVDLIPSSWQYPEITCSRIILKDNEYKTKNFRETEWKQANDILVQDERVGSLEICYLEEKIEIDEGPFIKEERNLINAISERVGHIIDRIQVKEEKTKLQNRLKETQKMESIGTLAGGIAHQFNNALFGITGNIDLLEMDLPGDEIVANYTKPMKDSAHRMAQLTSQLLAYARGGKYQTKTISVSDFVRETLLLVNYTIDSAIDLDTDLPHDILNVKADLTQMQMVLSAVLTNASEAIEGKGRIFVAYQKVVITDDTIKDFPGLKPGNYACLTVIDNGKGMDEETRTRIFEPFFTTKFEGRGLGMAAAYGIVKNHEGWISVDSELGKGTAVKIYLPAVETPAKEDVRERPKAEWVKGTGTILVIDDEEAVVTVCRPILEWMGYRVLEARSGQEAIDVVKTFDGDIDLAMLDIFLPGMSGETIYPLLMKARPDLKVLVFSGYTIEGPVQKILDAGAQGFIQKPFTMADLSEKLKKTLGGEQ